MAAGQREDPADAVCLQPPGDEAAAVQPRRFVRLGGHGGAPYPPLGGIAERWPLTPHARGHRVQAMSEPKVNFSDADLELLLVEADREDPYLVVTPSEPEGEPRESIDSQILAGLVSP